MTQKDKKRLVNMAININKLTFEDETHERRVVDFFMQMEPSALIYPMVVSLMKNLSYGQIAIQLNVERHTVINAARKYKASGEVQEACGVGVC